MDPRPGEEDRKLCPSGDLGAVSEWEVGESRGRIIALPRIGRDELGRARARAKGERLRIFSAARTSQAESVLRRNASAPTNETRVRRRWIGIERDRRRPGPYLLNEGTASLTSLLANFLCALPMGKLVLVTAVERRIFPEASSDLTYFATTLRDFVSLTRRSIST